MENSALVNSFIEIIGKNNVITGDDTKPYATGYRYGQGVPAMVLRPRTTNEVAQVLEFCNQHKIGVVPQGGNSGLVGASVADSSGAQIILNTSLLNKDIFEFNRDKLTLEVGAGYVLDAVNERLEKHGVFFPIDLGSSGICEIGGLIATNAAGTRAGRYGNAGIRTIQITIVMADGSIKQVPVSASKVNLELPQDNSKINFSNHFVGSQGWLGVITAAKIKLEPLPLQREAAIIVARNIEDIPAIRKFFANEHGEYFTAFECMSDVALRLVAKHTDTAYLFENIADCTKPDAYVLLVEISSPKPESDEDLAEKLFATMEKLMETGHITNALVGKPEVYWHHRHHISDAIAKEGAVIATDIAVHGKDNLFNFIVLMTKKLHKKYPHLIIAPFGHGMLGAMHFNVIWPKNNATAMTASDKLDIQRLIYNKVVHEFSGTFSAEHGIGPYNQWAYDEFTPNNVKEESAKLKKLYDPNGILNPNINYGFRDNF